MDNGKIAQKMQRQIEEFSGILSVGLPKVSQRLVGEALYGIQAQGECEINRDRESFT